MKKLTSIVLSITVLMTLVSCSDTKSSKSDRSEVIDEETTTNVIVVEETSVEDLVPETSESYSDPNAQPEPGQYISSDILYFHFYYTNSLGIDIQMYTNGDGGANLLASNSNVGYYIDVAIDKEHTQMIYDELAKYTFDYWQPEDYQTVDENGVITPNQPPYYFYIQSDQFTKSTEIKLSDEDLNTFLTFCNDYCYSIAENQK